MKIKDTEIKIIKADITTLEVDAIVNAANNELEMGGGVAGAIRKKGGKEIEDEAVKKGPIKIGEAVETSAGKLAAKYVIHAATMGMDFKTDEVKVRQSCASSLQLAEKLQIKSIAFPALGCGVGGFPLVAAAKIMAQEVLKLLREKPSSLKEIIFCLYDEEAYAVFQKNVIGYLEYVQHKLGNGPFTTVDAIIEIEGGIVLIERSNPPFGWALPGGFVDYGESLEQAVVREAKEETNLDLFDVEQFHTYSQPDRDPRFHTIGTVFIAEAKGNPRAGDDAKGLKVVKLTELDSPQKLERLNLAFDHQQIIADYLKSRKKT
jgi:O-acetyl-ADP-ribose deacetylase (regulator of RNase III)/ADP-ribose pyrophosphatase YjhB (NUDIX family)